MDQAIIGFHQDADQDWVAELACGHFQHTRHNPPWINRPWVVSAQGRESMLGETLFCVKCQRGEPRDVESG